MKEEAANQMNNYNNNLSISMSVPDNNLIPNENILHLYDLTAEINNSHIVEYLPQKLEGYKLKWLDEQNLLIICITPNVLLQVLGGIAVNKSKPKNIFFYSYYLFFLQILNVLSLSSKTHSLTLFLKLLFVEIAL